MYESDIKKKSVKGVIALTKRTFFIQVTGFLSMLLLGALLSSQDFGIYGIVTSFMGFLAYFSDIGLAGALIQKKEDLSEADLSTTFTIQQALVVTICIIAFISTPYVGSFYSLNSEGVWLFRALIVSFFLSSLKTIPSIILERTLRFDRLVIPQMYETAVFNVALIIFAWLGFGVLSFAYASLFRGIIGVISMYLVMPWRIRFGLEWSVAKSLFTFGIPFQWNSMLALLKDDLLFLVLGRIIPLRELGLIVWAKKWAEFPLRLIMDNVIRVTFPAFARLQHNQEILRRAIENTVFVLSIVMFWVYTQLVFLMSDVLLVIPKYAKWQDALLSFYLFCFVSIFSAFSTPLTNTLNAIGRIGITLKFMIGWTIASWLLCITAVYMYGYNGFAFGLSIISLSAYLVVIILQRIIPFTFFPLLRSAIIASCGMSVILFIRFFVPLTTVFHLAIISLVASGIYYLLLWLLEGKRITKLYYSLLAHE